MVILQPTHSLLSFIKGWFVSDNKTGCRFIVVDALNQPDVLTFYKRNGLRFLNDEDIKDPTRLMYFDLKVLKP